MKFRVSMKNPDCVSDAFDEALEGSSPEEVKVIHRLLDKWFEYEEYLEVEIDTETGTCIVMEVRDE